MGSDVQRIEFDGGPKMLDGLLKIPSLLENFVPEAVPTEESLRILGDHLTKALDIHASSPARRIIALGWPNQPEGTGLAKTLAMAPWVQGRQQGLRKASGASSAGIVTWPKPCGWLIPSWVRCW